ncbi:Holliday junction resolvase RuvX [Candidatus Berkelbacteria bacterium CG_4_10_14_0_8_um_filter_35_9_33_8]|uniref:Putative pre-16S rRNA nuclease n=1 Tax=Candidatus Berkelbacteria bacterium CG_4_10_14_0_2_um_filter_35_9_33_12 TaxID=1974499 RepID=A0A2M7W4Z1_9BACT|nr:MAG: Holliday junction resolvase RuvX [Candidatus Berkelbacteria bacterium CG23_combo_of_CG06-09_8_20_14_all_33_15]PIS08193.1 MAG: Holliday junction resolvase RuvX [Candidatus Berkelbacteria bacterium CG10_big_fil_rev_8_21_14_0_10_33_10]PIZ28152.1 MAG: Holliday junction resolvase RuvX [Candidatus Berkelbacteria bacterium CG_4_10_14_0_8_um_filter_35_9_33_8]PJA21016.1 MAG: Holliday junction resolvase RuvX [Candidatus Berkelbacteria bacterium CG_4_10_14_0_2_um_filter_35_9_33_12]PJB52139.1 MAG: 
MNNNILALDIGDKQTGVAVLNTILAISLESLETTKLLEFIQNYALQKKIQKIIIGLPVNDDGSENEQCQKIRNWAEKIDILGEFEIIFENEFLSSIEAQNNLRVLGLSPKEIKIKEHSEVARILLEQYLKNVS